MRDLKHLDPQSRKAIRTEFRQTGDRVRNDATARFTDVDPRSASGYKTRVRQRGIAVEQSIPKTTGQHPEYGALQMRQALLPALMTNQDDLMDDLERALDVVADRFNRS